MSTKTVTNIINESFFKLDSQAHSQEMLAIIAETKRTLLMAITTQMELKNTSYGYTDNDFDNDEEFYQQNKNKHQSNPSTDDGYFDFCSDLGKKYVGATNRV
jgi:hypothetical protein